MSRANPPSLYIEAAEALKQGEALDELARVVKSGLDINAQVFHDNTNLLMTAAGNDRAEAVKFLIAQGADLERKTQSSEITALGECVVGCRRAHRALDALIGAGADVNALAFHNWTALKYAAVWGDEVSVDRLLGAGADVTVRGSIDNTTALEETRERLKNNRSDSDDHKERLRAIIKTLEEAENRYRPSPAVEAVRAAPPPAPFRLRR